MKPSIRYLILALTNRCNLSCTYCYNGRTDAVVDMPGPMIRQAIGIAAEDGHPFHLQLTGGEPTLVPASIEKAAILASETGLCRSMGIQTNGTVLTTDVMALFKRYGFQVGVSLDGSPEIHQKQRGMAAETFRGLRMLEDAGIPFRVTTVVTKTNVLFLDQLILTLAAFSCARGVGLDLLIHKGRAAEGNAVGPADPVSLERGVRRMVFVLKSINKRRGIPIRFRERDLVTGTEARQQVFCHACLGQSLAVDPRGRLFPCGQTMGDPEFFAGTVENPKYHRLRCLWETLPPAAPCSDCDLARSCPGDCPSRLHYNRLMDATLVCMLYRTIKGCEG